MTVSVKVRGGVMIDGPVWANWEKPPANIVVGVEKVGLTLVVRGAVKMEEDTKDWEVRKAKANITY